MTLLAPDFETFARGFEAGESQVVYARLAADLDTPVSLMLKLAGARTDSFMLESVTGGEVRGRYSIVGLKPDLIWQCHGTEARINREARYDPEAFVPDPHPPLEETLGALDTLVRAFMRHQRATVDVTAGEDETARGDHVPMCLAETVLTAIRLSDRIPAGCWRWIVRRDGQHDTHTSAVLGPRVIDPLGLQGRDDLVALAVRVGLQDFATQDWEGSLLRIGAMPSVAAELHAGRLAPDRLAHVLRRQLRAQARGGGLSWSTEAGERGILAEIARRLDPAQPAEQALARHLAD